jgi:hypothetical protein
LWIIEWLDYWPITVHWRRTRACLRLLVTSQVMNRGITWPLSSSSTAMLLWRGIAKPDISSTLNCMTLHFCRGRKCTGTATGVDNKHNLSCLKSLNPAHQQCATRNAGVCAHSDSVSAMWR